MAEKKWCVSKSGGYYCSVFGQAAAPEICRQRLDTLVPSCRQCGGVPGIENVPERDTAVGRLLRKYNSMEEKKMAVTTTKATATKATATKATATKATATKATATKDEPSKRMTRQETIFRAIRELGSKGMDAEILENASSKMLSGASGKPAGRADQECRLVLAALCEFGVMESCEGGRFRLSA